MKKTSPDTGAGSVWGAVLIGGASSRMGSPKHLLVQDGLTWLELIVSRLQEKTARVVISGQGEIPLSLATLPVVPDISGLRGPLAGVLGLFRWQPNVSWLIAACDQPAIEAEALDWLLSWQRDDIVAVLPDLLGNGLTEPLLAYYDFRCRGLLEELVAGGSGKLGDLAGRKGVITPQPPARIRRCWQNINTPAERYCLRR
jgi:molybdopterin-guanine dinucleotide biosynthesis protein A